MTSLPKLNCQKLNWLNATNNLLESLEEFAMGEYPNLGKLYLQNNKLTSLPKLNCQILDATNNLLESLEEFAMGEYLDLQRLYLDDVKLLNLPGLE